MRLGKEKGDNLKSNIIYSTLYQVFILIIPLITSPYISRVLGATKLGVYSYTQAFANYFVLFGMLGVSNYGNRAIARVRDNKKEMSKTFWEIYIFQVIMTLIVTACFIAYVFFAISDTKIIYILQVFYVVSAGLDISWFFFGTEQFKVTVTRNIIIKLLNAAAVFLFVKDTGDLAIYTFIMSFGTLLSVAVLWPFAKKQISFVKVSYKGVLSHIKPNLVLFIPVIAISLYNIMDKLMLGWLSTDDEVAFYTNAEKIAQIPNSIVMAVGNVLMPRMSNLLASGKKDKSRELFAKSMILMSCGSILFAFGLSSVSQTFAVWFYGAEFATCGIYIAWFCPTIVFKSIAGSIRTQLIIPSGKDNIYIYSVFAGAAVNLVANYFLIPSYQGLGAVWGTVLAEFAVLIVQVVMTTRMYNYIPFIFDTFEFCIVGLLMYICLSYIQIGSPLLNILTKMIIGFIVYAILSIVYLYLKKTIQSRSFL